MSGELAATPALLRDSSYAERTGRGLLAAIGELAHLAGWVASDAGRHEDAQRLYLCGMRAAHAGGDSSVAANNLSTLSYQVANIGDPRAAVRLAKSALAGLPEGATATTRALLTERVAWANAKADHAVAVSVPPSGGVWG